MLVHVAFNLLAKSLKLLVLLHELLFLGLVHGDHIETNLDFLLL